MKRKINKEPVFSLSRIPHEELPDNQDPSEVLAREAAWSHALLSFPEGESDENKNEDEEYVPRLTTSLSAEDIEQFYQDLFEQKQDPLDLAGMEAKILAIKARESDFCNLEHKGLTLLDYAVPKDPPTQLQLLLKHHKRGQPIQYGGRLLAYAVEMNTVASVGLLIQQGIDPNILLPSGKYLLHEAVDAGRDPNLIQLLYQANANPFLAAKDSHETALSALIAKAQYHLVARVICQECLKDQTKFTALISNPVNKSYASINTVLQRCLSEAVTQGHMELVALLLQLKAPFLDTPAVQREQADTLRAVWVALIDWIVKTDDASLFHLLKTQQYNLMQESEVFNNIFQGRKIRLILYLVRERQDPYWAKMSDALPYLLHQSLVTVPDADSQEDESKSYPTQESWVHQLEPIADIKALVIQHIDSLPLERKRRALEQALDTTTEVYAFLCINQDQSSALVNKKSDSIRHLEKSYEAMKACKLPGQVVLNAARRQAREWLQHTQASSPPSDSCGLGDEGRPIGQTVLEAEQVLMQAIFCLKSNKDAHALIFCQALADCPHLSTPALRTLLNAALRWACYKKFPKVVKMLLVLDAPLLSTQRTIEKEPYDLIHSSGSLALFQEMIRTGIKDNDLDFVQQIFTSLDELPVVEGFKWACLQWGIESPLCDERDTTLSGWLLGKYRHALTCYGLFPTPQQAVSGRVEKKKITTGEPAKQTLGVSKMQKKSELIKAIDDASWARFVNYCKAGQSPFAPSVNEGESAPMVQVIQKKEFKTAIEVCRILLTDQKALAKIHGEQEVLWECLQSAIAANADLELLDLLLELGAPVVMDSPRLGHLCLLPQTSTVEAKDDGVESPVEQEHPFFKLMTSYIQEKAISKAERLLDRVFSIVDFYRKLLFHAYQQAVQQPDPNAFYMLIRKANWNLDSEIIEQIFTARNEALMCCVLESKAKFPAGQQAFLIGVLYRCIDESSEPLFVDDDGATRRGLTQAELRRLGLIKGVQESMYRYMESQQMFHQMDLVVLLRDSSPFYHFFTASAEMEHGDERTASYRKLKKAQLEREKTARKAVQKRGKQLGNPWGNSPVLRVTPDALAEELLRSFSASSSQVLSQSLQDVLLPHVLPVLQSPEAKAAQEDAAKLYSMIKRLANQPVEANAADTICKELRALLDPPAAGLASKNYPNVLGIGEHLNLLLRIAYAQRHEELVTNLLLLGAPLLSGPLFIVEPVTFSSDDFPPVYHPLEEARPFFSGVIKRLPLEKIESFCSAFDLADRSHPSFTAFKIHCILQAMIDVVVIHRSVDVLDVLVKKYRPLLSVNVLGEEELQWMNGPEYLDMLYYVLKENLLNGKKPDLLSKTLPKLLCGILSDPQWHEQINEETVYALGTLPSVKDNIVLYIENLPQHLRSTNIEKALNRSTWLYKLLAHHQSRFHQGETKSIKKLRALQVKGEDAQQEEKDDRHQDVDNLLLHEQTENPHNNGVQGVLDLKRHGPIAHDDNDSKFDGEDRAIQLIVENLEAGHWNEESDPELWQKGVQQYLGDFRGKLIQCLNIDRGSVNMLNIIWLPHPKKLPFLLQGDPKEADAFLMALVKWRVDTGLFSQVVEHAGLELKKQVNNKPIMQLIVENKNTKLLAYILKNQGTLLKGCSGNHVMERALYDCLSTMPSEALGVVVADFAMLQILKPLKNMLVAYLEHLPRGEDKTAALKSAAGENGASPSLIYLLLARHDDPKKEALPEKPDTSSIKVIKKRLGEELEAEKKAKQQAAGEAGDGKQQRRWLEKFGSFSFKRSAGQEEEKGREMEYNCSAGGGGMQPSTSE